MAVAAAVAMATGRRTGMFSRVSEALLRFSFESILAHAAFWPDYT